MTRRDQPEGVHKRMPTMTRGPWGMPAALGIHKYRYAESYDMDAPLKAAWPYPGGKADIAAEVWKRFGDVPNFVEPFAGTAIVTLLRPHDLDGRTETLNDLDGFITNALRSITYAPEETAEWCDSPVNEIDLTAWHLHLKAAREDLTARLFADPFYCDPMLAGAWLWGIASWIGDGWCVADGPWINVEGRLVDRRTIGADVEGVTKQMPNVGANGVGAENGSTGILRREYRNAPGVPKKMPLVSGSNRAETRAGSTVNSGIQRYRNAPGVPKKMPEIGKSPNGQINFNRKGVQAYRYREGVPKQMPEVGAAGDGGMKQGRGVQGRSYADPTALLTYFARLSDRLRRVRFLCGDWRRAVKDSVTVNHGLTGVFLDPPYPQAEHSMEYHEGSGVEIVLTGDVDEDNRRILAAQEPWYQAAAWAVAHGDDPRLRIAVCGYFSEATDAIFPATWTRYRWQARGGYSNQKADGRGRENAKRECVWFSKHCIDPAQDWRGTLFEETS